MSETLNTLNDIHSVHTRSTYALSRTTNYCCRDVLLVYSTCSRNRFHVSMRIGQGGAAARKIDFTNTLMEGVLNTD